MHTATTPKNKSTHTAQSLAWLLLLGTSIVSIACFDSNKKKGGAGQLEEGNIDADKQNEPGKVGGGKKEDDEEKDKIC